MKRGGGERLGSVRAVIHSAAEAEWMGRGTEMAHKVE